MTQHHSPLLSQAEAEQEAVEEINYLTGQRKAALETMARGIHSVEGVKPWSSLGRSQRGYYRARAACRLYDAEQLIRVRMYFVRLKQDRNKNYPYGVFHKSIL